MTYQINKSLLDAFVWKVFQVTELQLW